MVQRFHGQFSSAVKPRPQKFANFIDRLTAPLGIVLRSLQEVFFSNLSVVSYARGVRILFVTFYHTTIFS